MVSERNKNMLISADAVRRSKVSGLTMTDSVDTIILLVPDD